MGNKKNGNNIICVYVNISLALWYAANKSHHLSSVHHAQFQHYHMRSEYAVRATCMYVFVLLSSLHSYGHLSFQGHMQDFSLCASSSRHGAWLNLSLSL